MTSYLITGATGLIGRHLTERLLRRGGTVRVLQRPGTREGVAARLAAWSAMASSTGGTLHVVEGDVTVPGLGLADASVADVDHVLHFAGLYDLDAPTEAMRAVNVDGTRHVLELLTSRGFAGVLHHASSTAVAGDFDGTLTEAELDVGQKHKHPYHRSKFDAERLVREAAGLRTRIYRPTAVVGDSRTGATDRVDGPYYLFKPIQRIRDKLPRWWPLIGFTKEPINMVPVDFVADAIVHLVHAPDLDGKTFHLVDPSPPRFHETYNLMADAAAAPRIRSGIGAKLLRRVPPGAKLAGQLSSVKFLRDETLKDWGIPPSIVDAVNRKVSFDSTEFAAATRGSGIECPAQATYIEAMWDFWQRNLDPDRDPRGKRERALAGKTVLITGSSSGVGREVALLCAKSGAKSILVARRAELLDQVAEEVRELGGECATYPVDLTDFDAIDELCAQVLREHGTVDVLINNAARSIRRVAVESIERFHDFERVMHLNFFAPIRLIRGLLPAMREQKSGAIVNVLSAGARMPTPNFSAYMSSKAALGSLTDTLGVELMADGVFTSAIFLPWVRTDMMGEAFKDNVDVMTPERAAQWVLDSIVDRQRHVANFAAKRRYVLNVVAPVALSRLLNVAWRISSDEDGKNPEFTADRMIARKFVKGKLM